MNTMKKRIVAILAAGLVALGFVSCVREQMTVFDATKATAPVLNSYDVTEEGVSASYTPGVFNQSFNQKMPVNHSLVIVSAGGNAVTKTVTASVKDGQATATVANLSKALITLGYNEGDSVDFEMVVRASMQEVSKDNGRNGYVDSEGRIQVRGFIVTIPVPQGNPWKEFTQPSTWGMIGSIASTGNSWGADEPMVTDGTWHACLNLALTATDEFKFRKDGGWDVNFGGAFAALGEPFEVKQDGANIKVAEDGTYDLFLNPETAQVVIVVAGEPVTLPSGEGGGDTPDPPVEQPKDPVTIYVQDLSGWEAVNLYMWGDKNVAGADLCGAWPGMAPAEKTVKIGTVNYKVFTVEDALGRAENLIFNGEGGQAKDISLTLESETFIKLEVVDGTLTGTVIDPRNPDIKILVNNKTDWDAIALYAYGDAEAFGGWPGATPVGFEEVKGVKYTVFGLPAEMAGKSLNLIFNNNGGGKQLAEFAITVPEEELFLNINANYYVDNVEGNPRGEDSYIYVIDNMGWGADLHMYAWGDSEVFGGWPGTAGEYVGTFCGVPAYRFLVPAAASGNTEHLIFNNGNGGEGNQFDGPEVVVGENLQYSIASDFTWAEASLATRVYVQDETGWDQVCLYVWGTSEIFGGWPGASPAGTEEIGGVTYKYFEVPASAFGNTANFILNNGGNGSQLENFDCLKGQTVNRDYYFHFTADNVTVVE